MSERPVKHKPDRIPGLGAIFVTLLIDIMGFSLIFTIIPELLHFYIPGLLEGKVAGAELDFLSRWFADLAHETVFPFIKENNFSDQTAAYAVMTMLGGFLAGVFSLMQFFAAPWWGSLSDRIGRRRTLQITISLNALSYLLWAVAPSFFWFLLSRFLSGLFLGNIGVATALVADLTDEKNRTRGMGFVGMAIGFGFILGPVMGGAIYNVDLSGILIFHPFSAVALAAALLSLLNIVQLTRSLPDPPPAGQKRGLLIFELSSLKKGVDYFAGYRLAVLIQVIYLIFFVAFEFTLAFYFSYEQGYSPTDRIFLFLYTGLVLAFTQGGFSRRMSGRISEKKQITTALVLFIIGFVLYALSAWTKAGSAILSLAGVGVISVSAGIMSPSLSALASLTFSNSRQGLGLGIFRSGGALARAIGPFAGGLIYLFGGPFWLFIYCGLLAFALIPFALSIPDSASSVK